MILSREHTDSALCGCAALLLAIFVPAPMRAQEVNTPHVAVANAHQPLSNAGELEASQKSLRRSPLTTR